jgi:hypothetical protein
MEHSLGHVLGPKNIISKFLKNEIIYFMFPITKSITKENLKNNYTNK